jgi:hypothetical protein
MLPYGTRVINHRYGGRGVVTGYGMLQWPGNAFGTGDPEPRSVYLVKITEGSSSHGPACAVWLCDHAEEEP